MSVSANIRRVLVALSLLCVSAFATPALAHHSGEDENGDEIAHHTDDDGEAEVEGHLAHHTDDGDEAEVV